MTGIKESNLAQVRAHSNCFKKTAIFIIAT